MPAASARSRKRCANWSVEDFATGSIVPFWYGGSQSLELSCTFVAQYGWSMTCCVRCSRSYHRKCAMLELDFEAYTNRVFLCERCRTSTCAHTNSTPMEHKNTCTTHLGDSLNPPQNCSHTSQHLKISFLIVLMSHAGLSGSTHQIRRCLYSEASRRLRGPT